MESQDRQRPHLVELRDIMVARDGHPVLRVPRLALFPGETLAILGPNGAGKSTLLQVMALLLTPQEGSVHFKGELVKASNNPVSHRRRMGCVFQEPLLFDTSVAQNVASGLRLRRMDSAERQRRVSRWSERFGITHLADRQARTLSGGEARRVSLARAFALEPELLILDEPFSALDVPTRAAILGDLRAALADLAATTVFVTHDPSEARRLADRTGVLIGGRLHQLDTTSCLFSNPATPEVGSFLALAQSLAP